MVSDDVAMKRILVSLVWICMAGSAAAQDRVIGLISLPEVFGARECAPFEPGEIALHAAPNDGKAIAFVRVDRNWSFAPHGGCEGLEVSIHRGEERQELPTLEYDYEMPAAIVLEQRDGWFKVRLEKGTAWLKPSVVDRFMPLADLFEEFVGVTSINRSFTGRLVNAPGALNGPIMPRVAPSQPVRVVEIRDAGGRTWVQIELLSNSACTAGADGPPEVIATGWLPMHDGDGVPTVWFASRGC
jgi:hypothetical protein